MTQTRQGPNDAAVHGVPQAPERRAALRQLFAAAALAGGLGGCGGGGTTAASEAAPAPSPATPQPKPVEPSVATPTSRLKDALRRHPSGFGGVSSSPLSATQGITNVAAPSLGDSARILPTPLGRNVNPNPQSLATMAQLWGYRRDLWQLSEPGLAGTNDANFGWVRAVNLPHPAPMAYSFGLCGLHFVFDGQVLDVLFGGRVVRATVLVDGQYMAASIIGSNLVAGVPGDPFLAYDTYVRFDFGSAATRRIAFYASSTIGPCAIAIGANDSLQPWDRSAEPSMSYMGDSYGGCTSRQWGDSGPFWEAAALLGIPHLDKNAIGGTGYAPNNNGDQQRDPANAFGGRLAEAVITQPDLFITSGGINDNFGAAALPLYATDADARAGFDRAVLDYFVQARRLLPDSVLVAMGPWHPNELREVASRLEMTDTIRAALARVAGPWIFVDNLRGGWSNSSGASAITAPWQTGTGNSATPAGDGNGDLYLAFDGVHPNVEGCVYLGRQLAEHLRPAILAL
jgi:lysophospholipase L1-like esterase